MAVVFSMEIAGDVTKSHLRWINRYDIGISCLLFVFFLLSSSSCSDVSWKYFYFAPGKGKLCEHVSIHRPENAAAASGVVEQNHIVYKYKRWIVCRWLKSFLNYFRLRCTTRCRYFYNLWAWMEGIKNWNVLLNSNSQRQHKIDEEFFEVREWRNQNIKVRVAAQGTTKTNGWEVGGESLALDIPDWAAVKKQQHSLIKPIAISFGDGVLSWIKT